MKTREQFLTQFAGWLLEAGHAETQLQADRKAWDFVVPAWTGDDDLATWQAAYEDSLRQ